MAERLLSTAEASDRLATPEATLRYWRTIDFGPKAVKIGRTLKYREAEVDAWIREQFDVPAVAG